MLHPLLNVSSTTINNGTIHSRKMMNEYLCRNFVAEQIVSEMSVPRVNRRSGLSFEDEKPGTISATLKNQMIDDEGSKNYKSWLSR